MACVFFVHKHKQTQRVATFPPGHTYIRIANHRTCRYGFNNCYIEGQKIQVVSIILSIEIFQQDKKKCLFVHKQIFQPSYNNKQSLLSINVKMLQLCDSSLTLDLLSESHNKCRHLSLSTCHIMTSGRTTAVIVDLTGAMFSTVQLIFISTTQLKKNIRVF